MALQYHEPVYRPILREAFQRLWIDKKLWIFSAIAGILLTGSVFDVLAKSVSIMDPNGFLPSMFIPVWSRFAQTWPTLSLPSIIFGSLNVLLVTFLFLLIAFTVFAGSVIAQGTVVYSVGAQRRGRGVTIRDALRVGARALWPVFVLNVIATVILLASRGLIAILISIVSANMNSLTFLFYLVSFTFFMLLGVATVIVEVFALNAMILQGATLAQGIDRGIRVLARHWVVAIETSAILFIISVGATILSIAFAMLLSIPYVILMLTAVSMKSGILFSLVTFTFMALFGVLILLVFGCAVQLHYTTWTLMYRKLGEGGVLPKLHRLARQFVDDTHVPGTTSNT